jgi:hypothetical protein
LAQVYFGGSFKDIVLTSSLPQSFENFFNYHTTKASSSDLLVVLKFFLLHELKNGEKNNNNNENEQRNISECIIKADVFAFHDDSYQALLRIDTSFERTDLLGNILNDLMTKSLTYVIDKISSINVDQITARKANISRENVMNYHDQRFAKPRIVHDSIQRCLYLTFNDFLFNRLWIQEISTNQIIPKAPSDCNSFARCFSIAVSYRSFHAVISPQFWSSTITSPLVTVPSLA